MAFIPCPQPPWSSRSMEGSTELFELPGRTQPAAAQGRDGNTAPSVGQQKSKYTSVPKYFPSEISLAIHWGKFAWLCSGLPFTDHQQLLQNHSGYSKIETLKEQQFISQYDQAGRRLIHLYFMQVKHTTSPRNSLSALLQPQSDQMDKTTLETIVFWQPKGKGKQNAQHC